MCKADYRGIEVGKKESPQYEQFFSKFQRELMALVSYSLLYTQRTVLSPSDVRSNDMTGLCIYDATAEWKSDACRISPAIGRSLP
jgi:hypothetical protein